MFFKITPKKILLVLISMIVFLFITHIISQNIIGHYTFDPSSVKYQLLWKFNLDEERAFGTWYAQIVLFITAAALLFIGISKKIAKKEWAWWWIVLGFVFVYLSIDEAVSLHEMLVKPVQDYLGITTGPLFYAWIIPVFVLVFLFTLTYVKFWLNLPRKTRLLFVVAFSIFMVGAVGMEMIAASYYSVNFGGYVTAGSDQLLILIPGVEETLEMLGIAIFLYCLLDYIKTNKVSIKLSSEQVSS